MRTMLRINMPVEKGNEAIRAGALEQTFQATMEALKPEAAYFYPDPESGTRTALFIFDLQESSQIPPILEPLFQQLGASVRLTPVMNAEDLQRGLAQLRG